MFQQMYCKCNRNGQVLTLSPKNLRSDFLKAYRQIWWVFAITLWMFWISPFNSFFPRQWGRIAPTVWEWWNQFFDHFKEVLPSQVNAKSIIKAQKKTKGFCNTKRHPKFTDILCGLIKENNPSMTGTTEPVNIPLTLSPSTAERGRAFSGRNLIVTNLKGSLAESSKRGIYIYIFFFLKICFWAFCL